MNDFILSLACFLATLALYFANKKLYRRRRALLLMPLVLTPMIPAAAGGHPHLLSGLYR